MGVLSGPMRGLESVGGLFVSSVGAMWGWC